MFNDTQGDVIPECKKPCGCPIEDIAGDDDLENRAWSFMMAMRLHEVTGLPDVQRTIFEQLGLIDDPETLLELVMLYASSRVQSTQKDVVQT